MATILEETIRLGVPADLAIAALSMPSRAAATGAMRYTIPGEGTSEFIRAKTPEEVAAAARHLSGVATANANPYAGRVFGNTIGQAQGASSNRRQQDIASSQFQQQMAAANDRARLAAQADAAERAMKLRLGQQEIDARRENSVQDFVARMAGVDARNYGTDARYGGAVAGMPAAFSGGAAPARTVRSSANRVDPFATTVADNLYDRLESLQMEQQSAEAPFMRELTDAAAAVTQLTGEIPQYEDGIPSFGGDEAQQLFASRRFGTGDSMSSIGQALAEINANRSAYGGLAKLTQTNIDRAKASGRLGLPVPSNRGATALSPLAALLLRQPGTAGPGGTIQYDPRQVAAARSALGWRGAYGGPGVSAFGTNPAEQARMQAARRMATMSPALAAVQPEPASQGFGDLRVSEGQNRNYRLVPGASTGASLGAMLTGTAPALASAPVLEALVGNPQAVQAGLYGTQALSPTTYVAGAAAASPILNLLSALGLADTAPAVIRTATSPYAFTQDLVDLLTGRTPASQPF